MPVQKVCVVCGKEFSVPPCRANTASTCSHECAVFVRAQSRERKITLVCAGCGNKFEVPRSHKNRRVYCSKECKTKSRHALDGMSERVRGKKNPMWNGGVTNHSQGYRYQSAPFHPYASNGYVFQHRLIVEKAMREHEPHHRFLLKHGDNLFLSPSVSVHHIDGDMANNVLTNLVAMTPGAHTRYHVGKMPKHSDYWPNDAKTENRLKRAIKKEG